MKKLSIIKKILLSICAVVCGACCFGAVAATGVFASDENQVVANAETTAPITVDGWGPYSSTNLKQFYIRFAGIDAYKTITVLNPSDTANDFAYKYIKINGKTLADINATTDVSGWTWTWGDQNNNKDYQKPTIIRTQQTYFQLRIHENYYNAVMASDGEFIVTFDKELTIAGVTVDKETSYQLDPSAATWSEVVAGPVTAPATVSGWEAYTGNLYQVTINFAGINAHNQNYAANPSDLTNYGFIYNYIKINGRTLADINANTIPDETWVWDWNVQQTEDDYKKAAVARVYENRILIRIHKNFYNAEVEKEGKFTLTIDQEFTLAGYTVDKETTYALSGDTWSEVTKAPVTVEGWGAYSSTNLKQFYIRFAGIDAYNTITVLNPSENANDFAYKYIKINGKTLADINATTDVSGWTWTWGDQNNNKDYQKPTIIRTQQSYFQLRIHENYYNAVMASDGQFVVTFDEDLMIAGVMVDKETSYLLNGSTWEETTWVDPLYSSMTFAVNTDPQSATLDEFLIYFAGFNAAVNYDQPADNDYVFRNMFINGVSIHDINKNMDVSGWTWDKFPQETQELYRLPVISCISESAAANGFMELRIHKNLVNELLLRDGAVTLTVSKGFVLNDYFLDADTSLTLVTLQETETTVAAWAKYPDADLYSLKLNFAGLNKSYAFVSAATSEYVLGNIFINGRSVSEINANTDVTGWSWTVFPQNADKIYQKAILTYIDGSIGQIDLRIHKNLYDQIIAQYGALEVRVSEGFLWNGYIDRDGFLAVKKSDGTFVNPELIPVNEVSVSRWQQSNGLSYLDIVSSELFTGWGYAMHETSAYDALLSWIRINGRTIKDINANTDVSGWEWTVFPSTVGATYQKPIVLYAGKEYNSAGDYEGKQGTLELRIHDNYWNTIKENGLTVTLPGGYYFEIGGTMYALSETIEYKKDPSADNSGSGGFVGGEFANWNDFQMIDGASVRMTYGSTGIRFTAMVSQAYLDSLTAEGKTYRLMMEVNRENSDKTAYVECTNFYEEKGYIVYNVAIVNLAESSYSLTYTARPYIEVTYNGATHKLYTETISVSRSISDIAYSAYIDISETYDEEKYPYALLWMGKTQYSPYTAEQREILAGFVTDAVLLADGVYKFVNESNGDFFMLSDNNEVNAFFNEYADKYVYYYKNFSTSEECVTNTVVGNASMTWKDWEAESILFMNTSNFNGNDEQFRDDIQNANVDKYGYVWEGESYFGQGWSSPNYFGSRAAASDAFLSDGWEFENHRRNSSILEEDPGAAAREWGACDKEWTASGDGTIESDTWLMGLPGTDVTGSFVINAANSTYVTYSLEDTRVWYNGVLQAEHAPFIEIGLQWNLTAGNVSKIYLEFKAGSSSYVSLDLSQWATTAIDCSASVNDLHLYVPVFEHVGWTGKITGLRIRIEGDDHFTGYFYLDYVRGAYDTRMIDTNTSFISAGKQHFENTGDLTFLAANMPNYRKALMFLTNYMADNGLINLSNFVGHNGSAQDLATSLISTYWDIVSLAPNSSYVNALYYKALMNMAYLEDALAANNLVVTKPTVKTTLLGDDITYNYTADQLRSMAEVVKTAVSANLNESEKTGYFKTFNVTVAGQTLPAGRFIEGYYGDNQIDFGAVALNLMILESGVATEEQKRLVLNWISSIDNLYEYVFAPKTTSEDIDNQYCWAYVAQEYGVSCQNGGAILFVSYYDILARAQVYGADNAYARLLEIMAWFADVKAAFEASGETDFSRFFRVYYEEKGITLQGNNIEGTLGLDEEFIENAILYALVPNAFFGMDTYYGEDGLVMQVAPNLPQAIGTWKMEQVRYAGLNYDIAVANNFVVVANVQEYQAGAKSRGTKLEVTLSYTGETPKVYVNNKLVTEGYTVDTQAKTVTITLDFTDVNVSVR